MPTLTLAHSPDADDLVMWWPLVGLGLGGTGVPPVEMPQPTIDTGPFRFQLVARDVEELNKAVIHTSQSFDEPRVEASGVCFQSKEKTACSHARLVEHYDITAISCAAYPAIARDYAITRCGASFGENYGPKLVVPTDSPVRTPADLINKTIAIPGTNTTAFMTLCLLMGAACSSTLSASTTPRGMGVPPVSATSTPFSSIEMLFSKIPGAVLAGTADAGLLIHEAQLTCADLGLRAIADMGAWWHDQTNMPLPLGLNVVRRDLDKRFGAGTLRQVADILAASVRHAVENPQDSRRWLLAHQGDRSEWNDAELVDKYLSMYVSNMTQDMGERGTEAIAELLTRAHNAGLCDEPGVIDIS